MANKYWVGGTGEWRDVASWSTSTGGTNVVDSYQGSHDTDSWVYSGDIIKTGNSFTGNGGTLASASFRLTRSGSAAGDVTFEVYAHSGTYGTSSVGTGAALATSEAIAFNTIKTSAQWVTLNFTGGNAITLTNGTKYVVVACWSGGSVGNRLNVGMDNTSPSHGGNGCYYKATPAWTAESNDRLFVVSTTSIPTEVDDVFIDANSGFGGGGTISLTGAYYTAKCHDFTATSGHNYTITYTTSDFEIAGSATFESGITWAAGTWIYFVSNDAGETITCNGDVINYVSFGDQDNGDGSGSWTLQDDLTITDAFWYENGVLDANDNNVTVVGNDATFTVNANTTGLEVIMGSGTWELQADGFNWSVYDDSNYITFTPETSTIKFTGTDMYMEGGNKTYNNVWVETGTSFDLFDSNTFNNFHVEGINTTIYFAKGEVNAATTWELSGTAVGNNVITANGNSISYYSGSRDTSVSLYSGAITSVGQSFAGDGGEVYKAYFGLRRVGSPTGNVVAKIYAHSGSYGTSSVPTGAALATSDNRDVTTITNSSDASTYIFTFSGVNQINLANGTNYVIALEYSGGDSSNYIKHFIDNTSPTAPGNSSTYNGSWTADGGADSAYISIYTVKEAFIKKTPDGKVLADYLTISYSNASSDKFYAGTHSTDSGHNTGWNFRNPKIRNVIGGGMIPSNR